MLGVAPESTGALLAPMSGISDVGMRRAAFAHGATLVVTEMVEGGFYTRGDPVNTAKAAGGGIAGHVVQIAGCRASDIAAAARRAEAEGAVMVDINMGCPAKKVVGGLAGSALMRDLDHAVRLVGAAVGAVRIPVSLKMRLGWDEATMNAADLARRAQGEGVALVTVHGRTRCQFYKGRADWAAIRAVREAVTIPLVANGDCGSLDDARAMIAASGADAVMVGRAAVGRPWLVGAIACGLATGRLPAPPTMAERREIAATHYETLLALHGSEQGVRHARKHLAGYAIHAGWPQGNARHHALVTATDPRIVLDLLTALFEDGRDTDTGYDLAA